MAATLDQIAAILKSFFAAEWTAEAPPGAGSSVLLFDRDATPMPAADFAGADGAASNTLLAHQRAASLADQIPDGAQMAEGWYCQVEGRRLSRWYRELVLTSRSDADGDALALFERRKAEALQALELNKLPVVTGGAPGSPASDLGAGAHDSIYATGMTPVDWYLPSSSCWTPYRVDASTPPAPAPAAHDPLPVPSFAWRVIAEQPSLQLQDVSRARAPTVLAGHVAPGLAGVRLASVGQGIAGRLPSTVDSHPGMRASIAGPDIGLAPDTSLRRRAQAELPVAVLAGQTHDQPVASSSFALSFDYCVVRFDRPWWDDVFTASTGWSATGYPPGAIASGALGDPGGQITLLTIGMIVTRNLKLAAQWTQADHAMLASSLNLGPFSLLGGLFDQGSGQFARAGMAVVAWICELPPRLPPDVGQ